MDDSRVNLHIRILLIIALTSGVTDEEYDVLSYIAGMYGICDILDWARWDGDSDILYLPIKKVEELRAMYHL